MHVLENKWAVNGTPIAYYKSASDELRLPDFLRSADESHRRPARVTAIERISSERTNRSGEPAQGTVATIHRPAATREASDSPDLRYATPRGVAFVS